MDVVPACLAWSVLATYRLRTFEVEVFISALFHCNGVFFYFAIFRCEEKHIFV